MTNKQIPYFMTKIECPVCGYENSYENIKQGSYTESGRDTDFAPTGREWKDPSFQNINPLLFFAGTCANCYYTREINSSYKEWKKDSGFKTYRLPNQKKKHLDNIGDDNGVIKTLGLNINQRKHPDESAIIKLLLAVYDENLLDRATTLDIARFYLRVAWVFREMDKGEKSEFRTSPGYAVMNRIQVGIDDLAKSIGNLAVRLTPLRDTLNTDLEAAAGKVEHGNFIAKKIESAVEKVYESGESLQNEIKELQSSFNNVKKEISLIEPETDDSDGFGDFQNFNEFLFKVKEKWQEVPVNESEALGFSLQYYIKAYQNSKEIKAGLQQLQASYMIAELSRRVDDNDQAMEYFKITSKQAHDMMNNNRNNKTIYSNAQKILEMSLDQARLIKKPVKVNA